MNKTLILLLSLSPFIASRGAPRMPLALDGERIKAVAAMLPAAPRSVGDPITKRDRWDQLRRHEAFAEVIADAEKLLKEEIPGKPDELYLDFSKTGNRTRWQRVDSDWYRRMSTLFHAECLENKGRFTPALEEIITAYCDERSWVMPAHDTSLKTWNGKFGYADLKACDIGMSLAAIRYVMSGTLKPELSRRMKEEVLRRNLIPFREQVTGTGPLSWWWITCGNNWNAVCLAGITEAALALIDDPEERAVYVVAAEAYSKFFLGGFTPDGYCSEGMGYWNYGYGHYILLTEFLYQATKGNIDLLQCEGARAAGRFAGVLEIQNGVHPAFADCSVRSRPDSDLMYYLNRRYGFGFSEWDDTDTASPSGRICASLMFSFPNSAESCVPAGTGEPRLAKRTWFPDAGVLICRPGEGSGTSLAAAVKGGHNAEHHNHNDVGTYLVVNGGEALLIDPGAEVYTRRTFSSQRYESKVLNSFGHPVPVVAGQLQITGSKARGEIVKTAFGEDEERIVFDLKSAYKVPELESLHRIFRYSRRNGGSFTVTDRVVFTTPQSFETALITLAQWRIQGGSTIHFRDLDEGVKAVIEVEGGEFVIESTVLDEDVQTRSKPERIAIRIKEPVREAVIKVTVTPDNFREGSSGIFNGDFELAGLGWRIDDQISRIQNDIAASGDTALRITDTAKDGGSNVISSRIPMKPGEKLDLAGRHYAVSGRGIGLYVYFYDKKNRLLNKADRRGNMAALTVLQAARTEQWEDFSVAFTPPAESEYGRIWIHSMNGAVVDAAIDDLTVRRSGKPVAAP